MELRPARSRGRRIAAIATAAIVLAVTMLAASPGPVAAAVVISHGSRAVPVVALTIDDGFDAANCQAVAEILRAKGATATFFPTAGAVAGAPGTWRRIAAMGFPIGNHTVGHRDLTKLDRPAIIANLRRDRAVVEAVIGRPMVRVLRPPFGAWNATVREAAGAAGFPTVLLWDTTFADSSTAPDASHLRTATSGTYGSVVLLHCGPSRSVRILAAVIDAYRARGIDFVTIPMLFRLAADPGSWAGFARGSMAAPSQPPKAPDALPSRATFQSMRPPARGAVAFL